jgi:hypothetical protein
MKMMEPDSGKRFDPELFRIFKERAYTLHQEIVHAPDALLEEMLGNLVKKHFFSGRS